VYNGVLRQKALARSGSVGVFAVPTIVAAAMPKCPICWMALMSAFGVGSIINADWLRPLTITLLLVPMGALFIRARRRGGYGPFFLGLIAAITMYVSKYRFYFDVGAYLGGATLVAASIWNAVPKHRPEDDSRCQC
jgi:hypothetical protein